MAVPAGTTDIEVEAFLNQNLSDLGFTQFKPASWETYPKLARINIRLPYALMAANTAKAAARGIPYPRLIREMLEAGL